jgi:hypothetical protein
MLLSLKGEDSGDQVPIPVSSRLPTGVLAWFSLVCPTSGVLRWRSNRIPPQVSLSLRRLDVPYALR